GHRMPALQPSDQMNRTGRSGGPTVAPWSQEVKRRRPPKHLAQDAKRHSRTGLRARKRRTKLLVFQGRMRVTRMGRTGVQVVTPQRKVVRWNALERSGV